MADLEQETGEQAPRKKSGSKLPQSIRRQREGVFLDA